MAEDQQKNKKKGPPIHELPNKQLMPLIGLGTYKLQQQQLLTNLLRHGLKIGYCKHLDTARFYNNEIALGKAIKTVIAEQRVTRKQLFIATKIFNHKEVNPVMQLKQALKLMQLSYVDLLYLHWPFSDMDSKGKQWMHRQMQSFWKDMEECVRKGYTKHLGISNFNGQMINQLLCYVKIKPVVLQIQVHPYLMQQSLIDLAHKNNIAVLAYTPLVRGFNHINEQINILKDQVIIEIANKHNKTPAQIVLKSTLHRNVGVIPRTTNIDRIQQNYQSYTVELTQDDMKKIRNINKFVRVCDGKNLIQHFDVFDY